MIYLDIPSPNQHTYFAYGRIRPLSPSVSIPATPCTFVTGDMPPVHAVSWITHSRSYTRIISSYEIEDTLTLRNNIRASIFILLDEMLFVSGIAYDLEITHLTYHKPSGGIRTVLFTAEQEFIKNICKNFFITPETIHLLIETQRFHDLPYVLTDFRLAFMHPISAPLFLYRAVETLRKIHEKNDNISASNKKLAWNSFRKKYQIEESDLLYLKNLSDGVRHGDYGSQEMHIGWENVYIRAYTIAGKFLYKEFMDHNII